MGEAKRRKQLLGEAYGKNSEVIIEVSEPGTFEDIAYRMNEVKAPQETIDILNNHRDRDIFCFWRIKKDSILIEGIGAIKVLDIPVNTSSVALLIVTSTLGTKERVSSFMEDYKVKISERIIDEVDKTIQAKEKA